MNRFLPRSLYGQTLLILLVGLIVSHAVGSWLYTADREQAVRAVGGFAAAQRIANLTRLVQDAPREWRNRIVSALSDQTFRVSLSAQPPAMAADLENDPASQAIKAFLAQQVPSGSGREPHVAVFAPDAQPFNGFHPMMGRAPMMHGFGPFGPAGVFRNLQVAMPLADGQWLTFATALPETGPGFSQQFLISMALMAVIILGVSIWVVRRVTAPLSSLAFAAERLGRDVTVPPLPETGTIETRQASRAFNEMQVRLRNLIENRTRMLAAISHDLRTPLTLLRLRTENVGNPQERERMLGTIADMDAMVDATLKFARDEALTEPQRPTDITALLQSITDDMSDTGQPVTMKAAKSTIYECRPGALKRAFTNLIDNAIKYGKVAHVAIDTSPTTVEITIDDEGLGIPELELSRVFEPFYRLEESRNRDTGGIGLGLAIAQSIVQSHGGTLTLRNRPNGGLRASVVLPR